MEKDKLKSLTRFLKENGLYISFRKNFSDYNETRTIWINGTKKDYQRSNVFHYVPNSSFRDYWGSLIDKKDAISYSFPWALTIEGFEFWDRINNQWIRYINYY